MNFQNFPYFPHKDSCRYFYNFCLSKDRPVPPVQLPDNIKQRLSVNKSNYIATENKNFQPMNANFGILPSLDERIKDKKLRYAKLSDRAIEKLSRMLQ